MAEHERLAPERVEELERAAAAAANAAYSPYSKVRVGAALLAADGRLFTGCNVENASYGLTICAERVAAAAAVAAGSRHWRAIAITSNRDEPLMPCGACRQFLFEFGRDLDVHVRGAAGARLVARLSELLPRPFGPTDIGRPA
jgi:cytidine deaminase